MNAFITATLLVYMICYHLTIFGLIQIEMFFLLDVRFED